MNQQNERLNPTSPVTKLWGIRFPIPGGPPPSILTEDLTIPSIGHAFGQAPTELPQTPESYFVHDFLVDQSQSTGGGSALVDPMQFALDNNGGYRYILQAPAGKMFQVELPTGADSFYFSAWLGRQATSGPSRGVFTGGLAKITFAALSGVSPQISYNNFSIAQSNNDAVLFEIEGAGTSSFGFASLTIEGDYAHRTLDPGLKSYDPLSYAVPLGTKSIYPKSETFVLFGYHTAQKTDPGRFVRIAQLIAGG